MKNRLLLNLFVLFFTASTAFSQPAEEKDTAKIGLFVTNLYDFDLADGSFMAEFWTWALYKNDSLSFEESQEVTNSKKAVFSNSFLQKKDGWNWLQKKCTVQILQDWDVRNFPFDRQKLNINLEEAVNDANALVYLPDIENSKIRESLALDEWSIDSFVARQNLVRYNTTYGDPVLRGESVYPALSCDIFLTRQHSWVTFFKLATGVYVAFLISLLVFRLLPPSGDSRIGLAVGGLFAAVGNKYIVESVVPTTTQTTLIDLIHLVTFGAILAIVMLTIHIGRLDAHGQHERVERLDRQSLIGILAAYALINLIIIFNSLS